MALESETLVNVKISKKLAERLETVVLKTGFQSSAEYASYLLTSILNEIEQNEISKSVGGRDEIHPLTEMEIAQIREELRPLIWISC